MRRKLDEGEKMPESGRMGEPQERGTTQQEYWAAVYEQYHEQVRGYLARRVRCSQDAEDLAQEVFIDLIQRDRHPHNARPYVYTAA